MAITIVGLTFAVTGMLMLWLAMRTFARDRAITRWPRTDGVVTSAELQESTSRITDKNTGLHSYRTYYTPIIRYTYTVGVDTFEGTSISRALDNLRTSRESAQPFVEKYAPTTRVSVLYDPADPKTAYLEVQRSIGGIILLAFGLVMLGVGGLVLILAAT